MRLSAFSAQKLSIKRDVRIGFSSGQRDTETPSAVRSRGCKWSIQFGKSKWNDFYCRKWHSPSTLILPKLRHSWLGSSCHRATSLLWAVSRRHEANFFLTGSAVWSWGNIIPLCSALEHVGNRLVASVFSLVLVLFWVVLLMSAHCPDDDLILVQS